MASVLSGWNLAELAMKHLRIFLLYGPPGTGKTFAGIQMGESTQGCVSLNFFDDQMGQEFLGHYVPSGTEWSVKDGTALYAFREGKVCVANELGRASNSVRDAFLPLLDSYESARIITADGETVRPAKGFRCVLTSNDDASDLDWALRDRMQAMIKITHPHPGITSALNSMLPKLGQAVHDSYNDPNRIISTRQSFGFAQLIRDGVSPENAAVLTYGPDKFRDVLNAFKLAGVSNLA